MRCFVKVFGGVFVLGRVAAADVPADEAHAQMDPSIAELNAILTNMLVRFSYFDLIKVGTFFCHRFLRVLAVPGRNAIPIMAAFRLPKEPQNESAFRRSTGGIRIHRGPLGVKA